MPDNTPSALNPRSRVGSDGRRQFDTNAIIISTHAPREGGATPGQLHLY